MPRVSLTLADAAELRGRLPVVDADERLRRLGALERELSLGQPRGRGGLLQEVPVDAAEGVAHPLVQVRVGELGGQQGQRRLGLLVLGGGDSLLG